MLNKTLQELTIKDNFMFGAVMTDEEICREFLEMTLKIPIGRVQVSREKSISYNPQYKGVRLDVYAKNEENTHFNIEMQVARKPALGKRCRYYHSQLDMDLLIQGEEYTRLPNVYVIFICDFDPFREKKYFYSFGTLCEQNPELKLEDGNGTIFLSSCGEDPEGASPQLINFLKYIRSCHMEESTDDQDLFVHKLKQTVRKLKESREMGERFMIFKEMLREEYSEGREEGRAEGRAEDILLILENLGNCPEELRQSIANERDMECLNEYFRLAVKAKTIEEFLLLIRK